MDPKEVHMIVYYMVIINALNTKLQKSRNYLNMSWKTVVLMGVGHFSSQKFAASCVAIYGTPTPA